MHFMDVAVNFSQLGTALNFSIKFSFIIFGPFNKKELKKKQSQCNPVILADSKFTFQIIRQCRQVQFIIQTGYKTGTAYGVQSKSNILFILVFEGLAKVLQPCKCPFHVPPQSVRKTYEFKHLCFNLTSITDNLKNAFSHAWREVCNTGVTKENDLQTRNQ